MGRRLATDVYVDGERYQAGTHESHLAEITTDVDAGEGKKPQQVSVTDRITNPLAWVDDDDQAGPDGPPASDVPPAPEP